MINVFKTTLKIQDEQKVSMQQGSRILKVDTQFSEDDPITLWYMCDPEAELVEETFYVVGTGQQLPDTFPGMYVDSVQVHEVIAEHIVGGGCDGRTLVWHIFFKKKPNVQRGKTVIKRINPNDDAADVGER